METRRSLRAAALAAWVALALAACAGAPAAAPLGELTIRAADLAFQPASLAVPAPGRYQVTLINNGALLHDVTFRDGAKIVASPGQSWSAMIDVPAGGLSFLCSVSGHAEAGMRGEVLVGEVRP